ncbi:MAG: GNAT family N-acetyltransferase [Nitrososphaerota archaeon]|jgi:ribosomal protein S18 acetylase RimI-like enzyme|nr:GNAT family N-acetyltransferase [Nitrososphaerota archaeon]MDG6960291.1 GNAT family N-acetyltransferase [Nitrososphaerota archaeon]MDG6969411.1 GNAT family N-acetyltransferase [Nitrososphaerota archaeon]MDG6982665.1 GNAT family N-acetyltransferase [Nitrososphaerota archaeon]MDG7015392.1 GNAT family N-acetyltransferase [Nitrososphaerota archaeon]
MARGHEDYSTGELSSETWGDFERLFRKPGEWSSCQCMWFHRPGPRPREEVEGLTSKERNEKNFRNQRELVKSGVSHGILVYADGDPVGWCQYGVSGEFPRIDNAAKYRNVPPADAGAELWRITCFCVDKKFRRKGAAKAGLQAAMSSIRKKGGGTVEAYPTTLKEGLALHRGTVSMFKKEGFTVVAPLGTSNKVVRKKV